MEPVLSPKALKIKELLVRFVEDECLPCERTFLEQQMGSSDRWRVPPCIEELKKKAKALGLWNLFLPREYGSLGAGLTNLEYAVMCEIMGAVPISCEACNCSAPDTGNMEVLAKYGTDEQKRKWLEPLLDGRVRSAFLMTEPAVASSDATNICTRFTPVRDATGNVTEYVINGRKWWSSGAMDPRCKITVCMGRVDGSNTAPKHLQQSMILMPMDLPGITVVRPLTVFGYDDAPHGHAEILMENVRVPASNLLLGEGRGFEISQGRLGPGRIHHCMRTIGVTERALKLMVKRSIERTAFGKPLAAQGTIQKDIADSRMELEAARLLTYHAAEKIDGTGSKDCRMWVAMIKVQVPNMALRVLDRAIQCFGAAGVSNDTPLAYMHAQIRTLRIADGPDAVHRRTIALMELGKYVPRETIRAIRAKL